MNVSFLIYFTYDTNSFKAWPESHTQTKQNLPDSTIKLRDLLKGKITSWADKYVNKNNDIKIVIHGKAYFSQICFSLIIYNNSC